MQYVAVWFLALAISGHFGWLVSHMFNRQRKKMIRELIDMQRGTVQYANAMNREVFGIMERLEADGIDPHKYYKSEDNYVQ